MGLGEGSGSEAGGLRGLSSSHSAVVPFLRERDRSVDREGHTRGESGLQPGAWDLLGHRPSLVTGKHAARSHLPLPGDPVVTAFWSWLPGLCLWLEAWAQKFLSPTGAPGCLGAGYGFLTR